MKAIINIITQFIAVIKRFPLTMVCAGVATGIGIYFINYHKAQDENLPLMYTALTAWLGLTLFFSIQLFCESKNYTSQNKWLLYAGGLLLLVLYRLFLINEFQQIEITRYILFNLGLHLLASFAPFMASSNISAFWQYNEALFIRILTAALYSVVLYIGIAGALLAIDNLFSVHINGDLYGTVWLLIAGVFNTAFFLADVPHAQHIDEEKPYPKGLKLFTQFVLLPLVSLYLLILYGYLTKIIIKWSLPLGWVSYLIIAFSICGIFALLLIYPIRNNNENKWIKTFSKAFYIAIVPLIGLLFVAIFYRVHQYGVTELRYYVLLLAFWLLGMAIYFLTSKTYNIKVIPVSLAILCFASSFGPWGAFMVARNSQINTLEQLLTSNKILVNGKVVKATKPINTTDNYQITSIINYLDKTHGFSYLQPWFTQNLDSILPAKQRYSYHEQGNEIHKLLGIKAEYDNEYDENRSNYFYYHSRSNNRVITTLGYDYFVDFSVYSYNESNNTYDINDRGKITLKATSNQLIIQDKNSKTIGQLNLLETYNTLAPFVKDKSVESQDMPLDSIRFSLNADKTILLQLKSLSGTIENDSVKITTIEGYLLLKK